MTDRMVPIPRDFLFGLVGFLNGVSKLDGPPSDVTRTFARLEAEFLRSSVSIFDASHGLSSSDALKREQG